jgi:MoaA/NifB/PqqE/SkfB family radical SAM enzyme
LSRERSLEIAEEIGRSKTWVVGFTGGEVLLWPFLFDVIRILKQHHVVVYIVTNGLLLEKFANQIVSSGVDTVVVSIDSDDASQHDDVRKVEGLYQKAIDGIEKLKFLRKGQKPHIKSTTVVFRTNLERLKQIIGRLELIVDETSIQPIVGDYEDHPHNRGEQRLAKFLFESDDMQIVEKTLDLFFKRFPAYRKYYFQMIPTHWNNPQHLVDTVKCWSPFLRLQIMPNGTTRQCTVRSDYGATGNLNQCSLMDAWNSIEMKRQREEIRHHCNNCICWTQDTAFNAVLHQSKLARHLPVFQTQHASSLKIDR